MSAPKVGDVVTVHVEHVRVSDVTADHRTLWVEVHDAVTGDEQVPLRWCTVETLPLKVGDVLTEKSPEPPVGTILRERNFRGTAWQRFTDGWASVGGHEDVLWSDLSRDKHELTVLHVGGES